MQNYYLNTLGLDEHATKKEIKAAYRKLSKLYHPDVSKDAGAHDNFIAINEAYNFLISVGPQSTNTSSSYYSAPSYDFDIEAQAYEQKRREAYAKAQRAAREAQRRQNHLTKKILRGFELLTAFMIVINVMLEVDKNKPLEKTDTYVVEWFRGKDKSFVDLQLKDHLMRIEDYKAVRLIKKSRKLEIEASAIFNIPVYLYITSEDGSVARYYQEYSAIGLFSFFGKLILICVVLYRFVFKTLDGQLSMAIFMIFIYLMQITVLLSY